MHHHHVLVVVVIFSWKWQSTLQRKSSDVQWIDNTVKSQPYSQRFAVTQLQMSNYCVLLHKSAAWVDKKQFLTLSRYEKETESASDHLSLVCVC